MTKKILLVLLFATILGVIMAVPAMAASSANNGNPMYYDGTTNVLVAGYEFFFANGTPITIEEPTSGEGALIKWEGGSQQVGPNVSIFGGMHDDDTQVSSEITMTGGKVNSIYGGGLHESNTKTATILINGGTVNFVCGGGASSYTSDCRCPNATYYAGDAKLSPCQTETANVTITKGTIKIAVYGGGEGISNTGTANLTIGGGDLSTAWVTATGSNGNTTNANLIITGGTMDVVQSVNRGTAETVTVVVAGGKINDLYAGGESPAPAGDVVNATITKKLYIGVAGEAEVTNMSLGSNGKEALVISNEEGSVFTSEDIIVVDGLVKNLNIDEEDIIVAHQVTINEELYLVQSGDTVEGISGGTKTYEEITTKEGYKFVGFVTDDGEAWDISAKIESDLVLKTVFEEEELTDPGVAVDPDIEPEDKGEKDDTSPTGVESVAIPVFATIAVISLVSLVAIRKRK